MNRRPRPRYSAVAQFLHWATAISVLIAFVYGPGGSESRVYSAAKDFDRHLHETLGLCVLALTTVRILWRMIDVKPDPVPGSAWMTRAATVTHGALYVLLFALPFTAIAGAWLEGHSLTLLGGLEIPSPLGVSHDLGATIANLHGWLGDAILWLAGLHAAAAIYHHVILKDRVLVSMLPSRLGLRQPTRPS